MDVNDIIKPIAGHPINEILRYDLNASQRGGNVVSMFNDFAVPAGLLYLQHIQSKPIQYEKNKSDEVISESLYDKLFNLAQEKPKTLKHKKTRRKIKKINNTTRTKK